MNKQLPISTTHTLIFSETLSYFYFYECLHDPNSMMIVYKCGFPQKATRMECRVGLWTFEDDILVRLLRSEARLVWNFLVEMDWIVKEYNQDEGGKERSTV